MNITILMIIIETALSILKGQLGGGPKVDVPLALTRIASAANKAYQEEVGQPIDPEKIRRFEPIP